MPYSCEGCLGLGATVLQEDWDQWPQTGFPPGYAGGADAWGSEGGGAVLLPGWGIAPDSGLPAWLDTMTPTVTPGSTVYTPPPLVAPRPIPGGTVYQLPDMVANVAPATAGLPWWGIALLVGIAVLGLRGSKGPKGWV